jgi:hypothetical protein
MSPARALTLELSVLANIEKDCAYQNQRYLLDEGPDNEDVVRPSPMPMLVNESVYISLTIHNLGYDAVLTH